MEESGLGAAQPDAHIRFSKPVGYLELTENVQIHGYHQMLKAERALSPAEIAADWYDHVFLPASEAIRLEQLQDLCPGVTEADFLLCVFYRRRELYPEIGCVPLEETAKRMAQDARRGRGRLRRCFHAPE